MTTEDRVKIFGRPDSQNDVVSAGCAGCGNGITWRLVAEAIDDLGIVEKTICCVGQGCHGHFIGLGLFKFDLINCLHGRAPAGATGVRRVLPEDRMVFTLQGDGDMVGEGCSEIIHAAARGERITAILFNNAGLGETGGDLCPTTLMGQRTKTSPQGRDLDVHGHPLQLAEMLATMPGVSYVARGSLSNAAEVMRLKRMIRRAFEIQMSGDGLTFVEVLSPCSSGWGMTPLESLAFVAKDMVNFNPVGEIKVPSRPEAEADLKLVPQPATTVPE